MNEHENYSEWDDRAAWDREFDLDFSGPLLFGAGAIVGAALMYLFDPDRGVRRRGLLRDKITRGSSRMRMVARRDQRNRTITAPFAGTEGELGRGTTRREGIA